MIPTLPEALQELLGAHPYIPLAVVGIAVLTSAAVLILQAVANCFDHTNSRKKF